MFKVLSKFKGIIALNCVLICTLSFGAVVSDNDGSAFITKPEFDSLKNSFQAQLDLYNTSIDSKIDTAISLYLAGIKTTKVEKIIHAKSILSYPLKLQMKNVLFDWDDWKTNGSTPYWAPNWNMYIWGFRGTCNYLINKLYTQPVVTRQFFNGTWDSVKNKFKISGMLTNVIGELNFNSSFYQYNWTHQNESNVTFGFVLDQTGVYARQARGSNLVTRDLVRASGDSLIDFYSGSNSYSSLKIDAIWTWGYKQALTLSSSTTSNEDYLNQFRASSGGGYNEGNNPGSITFDSSLKFDSSNKINFIMNAYDEDRADATGKRIELPVAYNNHIYMTNKNNFKADLQNSTIEGTTYTNGYFTYNHVNQASGGTYTTQWWFANMVSPGWTLEPQFSGYTSHNIHQRSFMEPHNMCYDVKTPYDNKDIVQNMSDGIVLTRTNYDFKVMNIKINIASEDSSVKKYLIMSTDPITQSNYNNIDTEVSSDTDKYLKISNNKNFTAATYKYELSEGLNSVYIGNIKNNKILYYKVLWDKDDITYLNILNEVEVTGEHE